MAYMQRITAATAATRPAVRQALQKASSTVPKRNYWGHRYHVVPVDVNRHFDRVLRDFERSTNSFWRWPGSYTSFFRRSSHPPEPFEAKLPNGERVYRIEFDLEPQLFKPEDIKVTVKKNDVFITARYEQTEGGVKQSREFSYEYSLPAEAQVEKVRSVLKEDGRLVIEAPLPQKVKEAAKGDREIPVKRE